MCTHKDTLAYYLGAPYLDNIMSQNELTTIWIPDKLSIWAITVVEKNNFNFRWDPPPATAWPAPKPDPWTDSAAEPIPGWSFTSNFETFNVQSRCIEQCFLNLFFYENPLWDETVQGFYWTFICKYNNFSLHIKQSRLVKSYVLKWSGVLNVQSRDWGYSGWFFHLPCSTKFWPKSFFFSWYFS